jgi:hypothetical protein
MSLLPGNIERIASNKSLTEGHARLKTDSLMLGKSTARHEQGKQPG